ncbi:ATP-binding protein [Actinokineospora iranica]|uniref:Anti-sigma regulatory factor (Ser/Thr protein kinase) n=1 Tax=Actinokineospora iranica TaxID=1271860 RepID=A0A1G6K0Y9_9PSEU|nr:ATP-binding protein [Actinokineospora iranica]SDC24568.1 Anti-sigma regulatory factor (Ser/Thr protein kinase) [Actinokineospora iranica]
MVDMTELDVWTVTAPARADQLPALRRRVGRWLRDHQVPRGQRESIVWIADEALGNAVAHSGGGGEPGEVTLSLLLDTETVVLTVQDQGDTAAPTRWRPGLGLALRMIRALADRVELVSEVGRTTFTACCARGPAWR